MRPTTIREHDEGEQRWFYGGGVHQWKLRAAETGGAFFLLEDVLEPNKVTPLHRHPDADEAIYVLGGRILLHVEGQTRELGPGGVVLIARGVEHAFKVVSPEGAKILSWQTPGHGEAFFLAASEPHTGTPGKVDFRRLAEVAREQPGVEILGPPPFGGPPAG
jgi:quercetin dioxygenase-like cupin family protein